MREGPLRIVVDTNVWVDSYCEEHVGSAAAKRFLIAAQEAHAELLYPVHIAKDVVFVLSQEARRVFTARFGSLSESMALAIRESAWACMRNMNELATPVGADMSDIWLADKYLRIHPDFEDNLVLAACRRMKANYLVTNDAQLIAHADVVAKTPDQMLQLLALD